jgi:hypothetical protein
MTPYYSPTTGGFYLSEFSPRPEDGIELTPDVYAALLAGVNSGLTIAIVGGAPTLQPRPAPTQAQLLAYADTAQWKLATGGYTITSTPVGGAPTALTWATDPTSFSLINGKAMRLQQPGAPASTLWQFATGFQTISTADFLAAAIEIADFMQATFATLETVLAAIVAGSLTSYAQIDAAAWPSNVSGTATP